MEVIKLVSTLVSSLICFIISIIFVFSLSPQTNQCASGRFRQLTNWVSVVFGIAVIVSYLAWKLGFSHGFEVERKTAINNLFELFFRRWFISMIVFLVFAVLSVVNVGNPIQSHAWQETGKTIQVAVEIWASSKLFNETVHLFKDKCPEIGAQWLLNFLPQHVLIVSASIVSLVMIVVTALDADQTNNGSTLVKFSLFFRLIVRLYQVSSFSHLVKVINKFHIELLDAAVRSSDNKKLVVNSPFYYNDDFAGSTTATRLTDSSRDRSIDVESNRRSSQPNNKPHITASAEVVRNDYTFVFAEAEKLLDLLKLVITFCYISAIESIVEIQVNINRTFSTDILFTTMQLTIVMLPWVYLLAQRLATTQSIAVEVSRRACIVFLLFSVYFIMAMMGGYLGCDFLKSASFNESMGKRFLIYLVKTSALPTTVSLAFLVITSPGVRRWSNLPFYVQFFAAPLIWLPQYTLQELHEAFGANFGLLGFIHAAGWIVMVSLGMFSLATSGVLIATVTGLLMLLLSVKLLWPSGKAIPNVSDDSSSLYKRLDRFLRDSKYGSVHVYFAYLVIVLYCLHGIFLMENSKNWYFFTVIVCFVISMRSHPAKRYWFYRPLHALGSTMDKYTVLDKQVTHIRGPGLCSVTLTIQLPSNANIASLIGGGDVIHIQNRCGFIGSDLFNFCNRSMETTHYFSVVSIDLLDENNNVLLQGDVFGKSAAAGTVPKIQASSSATFENSFNSFSNILSSVSLANLSIFSDLSRRKLPRARVELMIQRTGRKNGASAALVEAISSANDVSDSKNGSVYYDFRVLGFVKSHSLEAMHLPCVIAFGYESGSAAFCSLLKQRMSMKVHVEDTFRRVKSSNLTDLCVIWCQFMKRPRGRELTPSDVLKALHELVAFQEYLYANSGGRGVKMLFVCTGVPQEWTPDPECIVHRTRSFEAEVAKSLNIQLSKSKLSEITDDEGRLLWGNALCDRIGQNIGAAAATAATSTAKRSRDTSTNVPSNVIRESTISSLRNKSRSSITSSSAGKEHELELGEVRSSAPSFASSQREDMLSTDSTRNANTITSENSTEPLLRATIMSCPGTLSSIRHHFTPSGAASSEQQEATAAGGSGPIAATGDPMRLLVSIQQHPESWVPLRNALGSSWAHFRELLSYRVGAACSWLNSPNGPDYTSLFITEHSSDVSLLRDFKYSEVYDDVNDQIIQHQIRFSKNPINYCAGRFDEDGHDPVDSSSIQVGVLYSGDYATAKREHLKNTVERIQLLENKKKYPASLSFIPDA